MYTTFMGVTESISKRGQFWWWWFHKCFAECSFRAVFRGVCDLGAMKEVLLDLEAKHRDLF